MMRDAAKQLSPKLDMLHIGVTTAYMGHDVEGFSAEASNVWQHGDNVPFHTAPIYGPSWKLALANDDFRGSGVQTSPRNAQELNVKAQDLPFASSPAVGPFRC